MSRFYILFKNINIISANAISSPITYGFPAIGGFVGAIHALERRLPADIPLKFKGVLIASLACNPRIHRRNSRFILNRQPIKKNQQGEWATPPIIEEGKVDLKVSLVVKAECEDDEKITNYLASIEKKLHILLMQQRIAGGTVLKIASVRIFNESGMVLNEEDKNPKLPLINRLLPAYILTDASYELPEIVEELRSKEQSNGKPINPRANALDAILATSQIFYFSPQSDGEWERISIKKDRGWIVPIPVGYQAISEEMEAGKLKNARNPEYPAYFVESIYSLGRWEFPLSLRNSWENHFWFFKEPEIFNGNILYRYATNDTDWIDNEQVENF